MSGVPFSEVTAKDFIMVRAALVKRLGGANEALVWSRVYYRCDEDSRVAHDTDSGRWWAASYELVGSEVGLTSKQARNALERLVDDGFLIREQHALRNNYDRVYSYQAVVIPGSAHVPSGADGTAQEGTPHLPAGANHHVPSGADVPLIETLETKEETSTSARSVKLSELVADQFEAAWKHWPRKESKKKARDRFMALANPLEVAKAIVAHGDAHTQFTPTQFVPHLTTWLNQERWNDPLPTPRPGARPTTVDHGRTVDEMLRAAEAEQLSVTA